MATPEHTRRTVIGTMTGTSIDGIDIALVRIIGGGIAMRAELLAHAAHPLSEVSNPLRRLAAGEAMTAAEISRTAHDFSVLHAGAIERMLATHNQGRSPDLIAVHGQTVFHQPPLSWQLINAAPIAQRIDCPVVFDLRQADLAAGGQGAPITPMADWVLFRDDSNRRAIVNLGGYCNVTILPAAQPSRLCESECESLRSIDGFDLCVCNQLLDAIARQVLHVPYDDGGAIARSGSVNRSAADELERMMQEASDDGRSLGTGQECLDWLRQNAEQIDGPDLAATAIAAIARRISNRLNNASVDDVILAGGGVRNEALVGAITSGSAVPTMLSDHRGIPAEAREAAAMAVLGALSSDGVPITLPQVTGCRAPAPIAGAWVRP